MHKDHGVFIRGIEKEKKLELTFYSKKCCRNVVSLCAPLYYSKGPSSPAIGMEDELECYYLWDFAAEKSRNFLALFPSQIVSMELKEDDFRVQDIYSYNKQA